MNWNRNRNRNRDTCTLHWIITTHTNTHDTNANIFRVSISCFFFFENIVFFLSIKTFHLQTFISSFNLSQLLNSYSIIKKSIQMQKEVGGGKANVQWAFNRFYNFIINKFLCHTQRKKKRNKKKHNKEYFMTCFSSVMSFIWDYSSESMRCDSNNKRFQTFFAPTNSHNWASAFDKREKNNNNK